MSRVTLQQHYNFVMNQAVSITYDLWHIIFMKIGDAANLLI